MHRTIYRCEDSCKQAILEFGTDNPDLRNPLRIIDLTEFFQSCSFKPFIGRTVRAIRVKEPMSKGFHEKLLSFATGLGMVLSVIWKWRRI